MKMNKTLILAGTAIAGLFTHSIAMAQSTGTEASEENKSVVIKAKRGPKSINGALTAETVSKSRATITQEFIDKQAPGQTVLQDLNFVPGVNFTNNDPYGSSGGNIRIHGFDGNRISLTFDGTPLNDTGNYAIYSNQQLDGELIEKASVNLGTTDVDSPTASAAGGTVAYTTLRPTNDFYTMADASVGSFDFQRAFLMVNTGKFYGFTAWLAASKTDYSKFKGTGGMHKVQYNGRLYRDLGNGDFASIAFNWNVNRNYAYRNLTLAQWQAGEAVNYNLAGAVTGTLQSPATGDYDTTCVNSNGFVGANPTPVNGTAQTTGGCTNYAGQRINPSDTGSIRGQFKKHITDNLVFTFDPSFQYVLANGGTQFEAVKEKDSRLDHDGTDTAGKGVDLNGDGDTLDTVNLFRPSTTNTHRYGLTSSLIWDINDNNRLRGAYTLDYGRHRQTGAFGRFDADGNPVDVWGGRDNDANSIKSVSGDQLQNRNRFSIAKLEQYALEYRGQFLEDALTVTIGIRAPKLTRELNNYCYQPTTDSGNASDFPRCTTEPTTGTPTASGNVFLVGGGTTQYIPPISFKKEYKKTLPNLGISYQLTATQSLYASYAEEISAPRTDSLYKYRRDAAAGSQLVVPLVDPETTKSMDLGYRFQNATILASADIWSSKFHNRIVNTYDPETLLSVDRNVGDVDLYGFDGQVGYKVLPTLSLYGSVSYNHSELLNDLQLSSTTYLPTKGKKLVETPDWTYGARVLWTVTPNWDLALQGKYVGDRFSTDVNDQKSPAYTVFDLDTTYKLHAFGKDDTTLQLNVLNLLDENYLGSISSQNNALATVVSADPKVALKSGSAPTYALGSPRTVMVTLKTKF